MQILLLRLHNNTKNNTLKTIKHGQLHTMILTCQAKNMDENCFCDFCYEIYNIPHFLLLYPSYIQRLFNQNKLDISSKIP